MKNFKPENIFFATFSAGENATITVADLRNLVMVNPYISPNMTISELIDKCIKHEYVEVFYKNDMGSYTYWEDKPKSMKGDGSDGKPVLYNLVSAKEFCGTDFEKYFKEILVEDAYWALQYSDEECSVDYLEEYRRKYCSK